LYLEEINFNGDFLKCKVDFTVFVKQRLSNAFLTKQIKLKHLKHLEKNKIKYHFFKSILGK